MNWLFLVLRLFQPGSEVYADVVLEESERAKVDPLLVTAVAKRESGLRTRKCRRGSYGLMQIQLKSRSCVPSSLSTPRANIRRGIELMIYWRGWWMRFHKGEEYHWLLHYNQGFGRCADGTKRCKPHLRRPVTKGWVGGYARRVLKIYHKLKKIKRRVVRPHRVMRSVGSTV